MSARRFNVILREYTGTAARPGTMKDTVISGPHKWETAWRKASALNREATSRFKRAGLSVLDAPTFLTKEII